MIGGQGFVIGDLVSQGCHDDGREDGLVSARMEWREMCQVVVRGELSLYNVFLQPLLLEQAKVYTSIIHVLVCLLYYMLFLS